MKYFLVTAALLLSGCGAIDRLGSSITGNASSVCMSGVLYYQFTSGTAVAYNPDGSLKKCD